MKGPIKQIFHKDEGKRTPHEPFAAIHYDGSFRFAENVLRMIGVNNMVLTAKQRKMDLYGLIEEFMDDSSNLHLPEVLQDNETGLYGCRALTLHVDSWIVLEVDDAGKTEIVFYDDRQFNAKYATDA